MSGSRRIIVKAYPEIVPSYMLEKVRVAFSENRKIIVLPRALCVFERITSDFVRKSCTRGILAVTLTFREYSEQITA